MYTNVSIIYSYTVSLIYTILLRDFMFTEKFVRILVL